MVKSSPWVRLMVATVLGLSAVEEVRAASQRLFAPLSLPSASFPIPPTPMTDPLEIELLPFELTTTTSQNLTDGTTEAAFVEGRQAYYQGQLQVALDRLNGAIAQFEIAGNTDGVAAVQVAIAPVYITMENLDEAAVAIQAALNYYQAQGNIAGEAQALVNLGMLQNSENNYDAALASFQRAAELSEQAQDTFTQGTALLYMGATYFAQEEHPTALLHFDQALPLLQDYDPLHQGFYQATTLILKAISLINGGELDQAKALVETVQDINQFLQHPAAEAYIPFLKAVLAFQQGDTETALNYYQQSLILFENWSFEPESEAVIHILIGNIHFQKQDFNQALQSFKKALKIYDQRDNSDGRLTSLNNIANTYQQLGEPEKAEEYRLQVIALHQVNLIDTENSDNYEAAFVSLAQTSGYYANQAQSFLAAGREYLKSDLQAAIGAAHNAVEVSELALHYAYQMLQAAQSHGRDDWMNQGNLYVALALISTGQAYQIEANSFTALNQLQESLKSEERALDLIEKALSFALASENEAMQSTAYYVLIVGHKSVSTAANSARNYERSIETGLKAIQLSQEINNVDLELSSLSVSSNPYINLAIQYRRESEFEEALESLSQAESFNREIIAISDSSDTIDVDQSARAGALGQLWVIALEREEIHKDQNLHEAALEAAYESLDVARQLESNSRVRTSLSAIASSYLAADRYSEALLANEDLRQFAEETNDFRTQASALLSMATIDLVQSRYAEAIEKSEASLRIAEEYGIIQYQVDAIHRLSAVHLIRGEYDLAVEQLDIALVLIQENRTRLEDPLTSELLNEICYLGFSGIFSENRHEESDFLRGNLAIVNYQQNLDRQRFERIRASCIESTWGAESSLLIAMGDIYSRQGSYPEAIAAYEKSIKIDRHIGSDEASAMGRIGNVYQLQGDYENALNLHNKVLETHVSNNNRLGQAIELNRIATIYYSRGQYGKALDGYQQALALAEQIGNQSLQNSIMLNLGRYPGLAGDFQSVLDTYYDVLEFERRLGRKSEEVVALNAIGEAYTLQAQLERAEHAYAEALAIARGIGIRASEINSLSGLGDVAEAKGDYATALNHYDQALEIAEKINSQVQVSTALSQLGYIYFRLGQYATALDYYQRSLDIDVANGSVGGQAATLSSMGGVYYRQQQYDQALDYNQQALAIHQDSGNLIGQARVLDNLGGVYERQGNYEQALTAYQAALELVSGMDARSLQASVLGGLGLTHAHLGDTDQAMDYLEQALVIHRDIGNPAGEAIVLADMGKVLAQSSQEAAAITFYKQAVNTREGIREGLRSLDQSLQQSYIDSISETYRTLANLLLSQGRIPEAQQVLDLLQLEELREFTNTRAVWTGSALAYTEAEQPIADAHGDLIAFGQQVSTCRRTNCPQRNELEQQLTALNTQYRDQIATFQAQVGSQRRDDEVFQDPRRLSSDARALLAANPNSVLIYPFVTEDKLWLLWATPGAVGTVEVAVSQAELSRAVQQLGERLTRGGDLSDLQSASQKLYDWLVRPLEAPLEANGIEKLIFVNDRVTRYIPMAVLFDGERYLLERYTLSTVLSPAVTNTTNRIGAVEDAPVLGLGLTQAFPGFNPLPAVREELSGIVRVGAEQGIFPGSVFLDGDFTLEALERNLLGHRVLHIATHAAFVPGRSRDSYILLGDGSRLAVADIEVREHLLADLHLVVLSACQTALGGVAGDGAEIAGISSYFLQPGRADTVIASLWSVNDTSTSVLMQRFYTLLATGELTKAEALRQAQLSLLRGEDLVALGDRLNLSRGSIEVISTSGRAVSPIPGGYGHPYHWAPFILIGNGL